MIYKFILTIVFVIFFSSFAFPQLSFIPLSVDYATFYSTAGNAYLEIYVSFHQAHIRYLQSDSGYVAEVAANTEIFSGDSLVTSYSRQYHSTLESPDQVESKHQIMDVYFFELPPGKYTANIKVSDAYSMASGEFVFDFNITPFKSSEISLSDIELCTNISQDTTHLKFRKGHLQVIPNPSSLYGFSLPVLYYYAEAYNFAFSDNGKETFRQESYITDKSGNVIKVISDEVKQKPGNSAVLVGGSNIAGLPGNTYFLNLRVTDQQTGKIAKKTKRFTLVKPSAKSVADTTINQASSQNVLLAMYATYNEEDLNLEFEQARYIAAAEEERLFPKLDLKGKRQFLITFWERRDHDPSTIENEFRNDYLQRVEYASKFLKSRIEGWKTDRGRVVLIYGVPDNIDRFPNPVANKPYEIWNYPHIEGGVIFVFADLSGFGDYELVHSTHPFEFKQPNWMDLITPGIPMDNQ